MSLSDIYGGSRGLGRAFARALLAAGPRKDFLQEQN